MIAAAWGPAPRGRAFFWSNFRDRRDCVQFGILRAEPFLMRFTPP
jgi:hypothetical protein